METLKTDKKIDIRGVVCPYTLVKSKLAIEDMEVGHVLEILLDFPEAKDSIAKTLRDNPAFIDSVKKLARTIEVGFVVINPHDGNIVAMVGGANFRSFKYGLNHVTQIKRQPGSAFKPFVYTTAIDNGYAPCVELHNQPVTIPMPDGTRWTPSNYDGAFGGKYSLRAR